MKIQILKPIIRDFIVLDASHALAHIFSLMHLALLPVFMDEFGLSTLQASFIVTIPLISEMIVGVPGGFISDRIGHKRLLIASLLVIGASAILISGAKNVYTLILLISILRSFLMIYHPPSLSLASDWFSIKDRAKAMGFHGASGSMGMAIGPISLGLLMPGYGWRAVYLLWGVVVLSSILPLLKINVDHRRGVVKKMGRRETVEDVGKTGMDTKSFITMNFVILLFLISVRGMGFQVIDPFITTYFSRSWMVPAALASLIFGMNFVFGVIGSPVGGFMSDRFGEKTWLTIAYSLGLGVILLVALAPSLPLLIIFYLIQGFLSMTGMAATTSLVARFTSKNRRGLGYAIFMSPMKAMGAITPPVTAWIIESLDIWYIFPLAALISLISIILVRLLRVNR